jgi:uncharacterized protein
MSSPTKEWLVKVPDHAGALEKRMASRPAHFAGLKGNVDSGVIVFGGALLSKQPEEGEAPAMNGSFLMVKADTEEDVWKLLKQDPYTKGGAWNMDAVEIWPFKCAIRTAM